MDEEVTPEKKKAERFAIAIITAILILGFGFVFAMLIWSAHQEQVQLTACKKSCFPVMGDMIQNKCLCATETGWEPKK